MKINLEDAEYVVDLIAGDLPHDDAEDFFDEWLKTFDGRSRILENENWEFVEKPTTYEGSPAREILIYWDSNERLEEPMMIIVVAKNPTNWAKGYVYLTDGMLKDSGGKQVIIIFMMRITGNKTEKYLLKKSDYDVVQAMLENEGRKQITVIPQSINKTVIS